MDTTNGKRIRIEVGTNVKGHHTYSATVEWTVVGDDAELTAWLPVLAESDELVASLDLRYPAPEA
jgi:hypothetical protein